MVEVSEIVDVTITVQSSAIAQTGFDSLLVVGNGGTGSNDGSFNGGWANHEVRPYDTFNAVANDPDIKPNSNVENMALVAFSQIPAASRVYVSRVDENTPVAQVATLTFLTGFYVDGQTLEAFLAGSSLGTEAVGAGDTVVEHDAAITALAALYAGDASIATATPSDVGGVGYLNTITLTAAVPGESFLATATVSTGATLDEAVTQVITTVGSDKLAASDLASIAENNNNWFGYVHDFTSNTDAEVAAAYAAANRKFAHFLVQNIADLPNLNTNFAAWWYTTSADSIAQWLQVASLSAYLGREVGSYNPSHQLLETVDSANLSTADDQTLRDNFGNQYTTIAGADVTYDGRAANGGWIDTYINVNWVTARMEERIFGGMVSSEKIPYDDSGIQSIGNLMAAVLQQAEDAGIIASEPKFTIQLPSAASVPPADRSARLLQGITFTAYTGAPINRVKINGTLVD